MAYQTRDGLDGMHADADLQRAGLHADSGAIANDFPGPFQTDMYLLRPAANERTALGTDYLAGLAAGFWSSREEISRT